MFEIIETETAAVAPKPLVWRKVGPVFDPRARFDWMQGYAQNPNALDLGDRLRVYFTCRPPRGEDGSMVSLTAFVDLDREDPSRVLYVHDRPVLELGGPGDFDQFGIMPGSIVEVPETGEIRLYYVGWTRMVSVPYKWSIGMATSTDGGVTFRKHGVGPIVTSSPEEPYLQACPRVWRRGPDRWEMWYQSGIAWNDHGGHMESEYVTMRATSRDGIRWERDGRQVIPSVVPHECQTSASVFEADGVYRMLFSYRHGIDFRNRANGYRIGHAWSTDLRTWTRDDALGGLDVSPEGWDSEMVCYPHVVRVGERTLLFYCGDYFGRDGFGYAELAP